MPFTTTATWPALANRTASAADVNNKFAWLEGHRYPHNSGALTTGVYDIGMSAYNWKTGYFNQYVHAGNNTISSSDIDRKVFCCGHINASGASISVDYSYNVSSVVRAFTGATSIIYTRVNSIYWHGVAATPINTTRYFCEGSSGISSASIYVYSASGISTDASFTFIIAGEE